MTPEEYVNWFYKKYKNCYVERDILEGYKEGISFARMKFHVKIIELIEKHNIKSVLEIGTWEGMTGLLIWLHPNIEEFRAIDIHKDMGVEYKNSLHIQNDKDFIGHYLKDTKAKVDFIDTMKWNPEKWQKDNGNFDMVFIDGNHDIVENDTEKSLKLNPKIIIWHDVDQAPVKKCLNEIKNVKKGLNSGWKVLRGENE